MKMSIFAKRLKEARQVTGLSQKRLGMKAGIDEFTASARVNRYERGVNEPDNATARSIAKALGVPTAYLYAEENDLAEMIKLYSRLRKKDREALVKQLREAVQDGDGAKT